MDSLNLIKSLRDAKKDMWFTNIKKYSWPMFFDYVAKYDIPSCTPTYEEENYYVYEIPVPGFEAKDIKVELRNDMTLSITGNRKVDIENYKGTTEFSYELYLDKIPFSVEAEVKNGILYIKAIKEEEPVKKIEVK